MDAKEYLEQILTADQMINCKLDQIQNFKTLVTHMTSTISDMPKAHSSDSRVEDIVIKIVDLENELDKEMDRFVDLKAEAMMRINLLDDSREQLLLSERYLNGKTWENIAKILNCTTRTVLRIHKSALSKFQVPEELAFEFEET